MTASTLLIAATLAASPMAARQDGPLAESPSPRPAASTPSDPDATEVPTPPPLLPVPEDTGWEVEAEVRAFYDDNVFRLSDDSIDRLKEDRPADQVSGRYDDMESEDDWVTSAEFRLRRKFTDVDGDDFRVQPGLRYDWYTRNTLKSHPEFFLDLEQEFGPDLAVVLDIAYQKDVFSRNYLADATDLTGSVSAAERVYESGVYDEWEAILEVPHCVWKRDRDAGAHWYQLGVRQLDATWEAGAARRWYDTPFSNRDRDTLRAGLDLSAEVGKRWSVSVGYLFENIRTDNGAEVMIRDEDDFAFDFNMDGDIVDQNLRTVQAVDRSRYEHELEAKVTWQFAKRWEARVRGRYRLQDYRSDEVFDVTHNGRTDRGREVRGEVRWEFRKNWSLEAFAAYYAEQSNRESAPGSADEEVNYRRRYVGLALSARF